MGLLRGTGVAVDGVTRPEVLGVMDDKLIPPLGRYRFVSCAMISSEPLGFGSLAAGLLAQASGTRGHAVVIPGWGVGGVGTPDEALWAMGKAKSWPTSVLHAGGRSGVDCI